MKSASKRMTDAQAQRLFDKAGGSKPATMSQWEKAKWSEAMHQAKAKKAKSR